MDIFGQERVKFLIQKVKQDSSHMIRLIFYKTGWIWKEESTFCNCNFQQKSSSNNEYI